MEKVKLKPFGYIYIITNLNTGKYYIGKTETSVRYRFLEHLAGARKGWNYLLCHTIRKHGEKFFKVETLCECFSRDNLNKAEIFFIWFLASYKRGFGYNQTMGGTGGSPTKEVRIRISEKHKGKPFNYDSPGWKAYLESVKLNPPNTGPKSEAHRKKIGDARRGKIMGPQSPERRANISKSLMGHKPSIYQRTPETKKKTSDSVKENWKKRKGLL